MKPKIGQQIRRLGTSHNNYFGTVIGFESRHICIVQKPCGNTDRFIYKFRDGYNSMFEWDGKQENFKG